ncbi:Adaptin ear-binding coat-associated protein-like protein [Hapsidospora chrysogenum ATCC 11550]|uniref:Adaptin ear-binding coat-associated protein-like protein n=1 Tax=Hapsidospora chrysogenum (strain ATCC 11550 / CBS 779.69 / DSM 880 / IAM 14645 / JCM 23072 / IMI 49137) TaxID=857340 RepID=A0A086SZ62_HAPC1|nr:Adaptin ear-binding coat-associated protein-like protein [Hapsidospora chrysogenum ATCC 11550]
MEILDPSTGEPLPPDTIQRVLFLANAVHVYNIPPLPSTRGHSASAWTADPSRHIFTARLRILETSTGDDDGDDESNTDENSLKVDVVLEDPSTAALFAASPYTSPASVEPVVDSSRFFAVTVRDPRGRKAVLGIGFEERSEAFDFGVALQEARRALGWEGGRTGPGNQKVSDAKKVEDKDYSLKEGETITVNIGSKGLGSRRAHAAPPPEESSGNLQSFALPPPPGSSSSGGGSGGFSLPPPPSAEDVKRKRRSAQELGFDDGQFGEFA